jgi:hypothetical protein
VGVSGRVEDGIKTTTNRTVMKLGPSLRGVATDRRDRDPDARDGPALQVEELPVDHLLRPERDLGGGLIVVGIERV